MGGHHKAAGAMNSTAAATNRRQALHLAVVAHHAQEAAIGIIDDQFLVIAAHRHPGHQRALRALAHIAGAQRGITRRRAVRHFGHIAEHRPAPAVHPYRVPRQAPVPGHPGDGCGDARST